MSRASVALTLAALTLAPTAHADPDDGCSAPWSVPACYKHVDPGFYNNPPCTDPGGVIRTEPSRLVLEPSGVIPGWQADGTRVMYCSIGGPK